MAGFRIRRSGYTAIKLAQQVRGKSVHKYTHTLTETKMIVFVCVLSILTELDTQVKR